MKTVIFKTENAEFKYEQKDAKDQLIDKKIEYAPDEVSQLLELISTDSDETILSSVNHHYFGYIALDLISSWVGTVTCKICGKIYEAGKLREFAIGHGKSPFDINQQQKGGIRLFGKKIKPLMFGGKGYQCPEGHNLISMETWRT